MNGDKIDRRFRDSRARILTAAAAEIVVHGVAGARISRIAKAAGTSKERLYAYFRNKAALVRAVAVERTAKMQNAVRFDAQDLVGYVGGLFDFCNANPDELRMSYWMNLAAANEMLMSDDEDIPDLRAWTQELRRAQEAGLIDATWQPLTLFNLLVAIAMAWSIAPLFVHEIGATEGDASSLADRRSAAQEAARRLITP